jgi:glyoxylase-like metal-dependent hydrolase (beta-lactamase superfamily II)
VADYVSTRQVGQARVTAIRDAEDRWVPRWQVPEAEWRRAFPEADARGELISDMNVFHIALGDASVLIDTGFGDAPETYLRRAPHWRSPGTVAGLATIGVRPEDVTHVLFTHAHFDHILGATLGGDARTARFPRARHLINRADLAVDEAREGGRSPQREQFGALERLGLLDLVNGDVAVAPGIDLLYAPGESPGHSVVRVRSAGATFMCLGDLFHFAAEVEHLDWLIAGRDPETLPQSRRRFVDEAVASDALLVFSHSPFPCWGRIVRDDAGQRWIDDTSTLPERGV